MPEAARCPRSIGPRESFQKRDRRFPLGVFPSVPGRAALAGCRGLCAQRPALAGAADTARFAPCSPTVWQPRGWRAGRERGVGEESPGKPVPAGEPASCSRAAGRAVTLCRWRLWCCSPRQADDLNLSLAGKAPGGKTSRVNLEGRLLKH